MILLLSALLAPDAPSKPGDSARASAERQCRTALARKAGGEISDFSVAELRRSGRALLLEGTARVLTKPARRPGEMTPAHVVNMHYSFRCRLTGGESPRIELTPVND